MNVKYLEPELLHPDTPVRAPHVVVHLTALLKRPQALPADVRLAVRTGHMVAPRDALDHGLASRTLLHVARARPLLEQLLVLALAIHARRTVVAFDVAACADAHQARRALQNGPLRSTAVYLGAVRRRAVEEFGGVGVDV